MNKETMNEIEKEKKMNKPYLIDNEPAEGGDIIKLAKEYGYEDDIYYTSTAANILRENGHVVSENLGCRT